MLVGATLVGTGDATEGSVQSVLIRDGRIAAIGPAAERWSGERRDLTGHWLAPAFIDSHVHLVYWEVAEELPSGGVIGAVDLAAPAVSFFGRDWGALEVIGSGPMITALGGYPTTSWGAGGYGVEIADPTDAVAAVVAAADNGAALIKIPYGAGPDLREPMSRAAIDEAHRLGLKVAVHALDNGAAAEAATLGADVLAHTPTEALADITVQLWSGKTVIATLGAFGGAAVVDNLRRLRAAGTRVLYGTDLGNNRVPGIDGDEIALMRAAGMDGAAILASATSVPAAYWGFDDLGRVAVGKRAALLVLSADPRTQPETLGAPVEVLY